jgi:hypothetical protein
MDDYYNNHKKDLHKWYKLYSQSKLHTFLYRAKRIEELNPEAFK